VSLPADNADGSTDRNSQVAFPCHLRMGGDDYNMTNPRHASGDATQRAAANMPGNLGAGT